ncbi:hypothetical protein D3C72_2184150 [compost metagenome]
MAGIENRHQPAEPISDCPPGLGEGIGDVALPGLGPGDQRIILGRGDGGRRGRRLGHGIGGTQHCVVGGIGLDAAPHAAAAECAIGQVVHMSEFS